MDFRPLRICIFSGEISGDASCDASGDVDERGAGISASCSDVCERILLVRSRRAMVCFRRASVVRRTERRNGSVISGRAVFSAMVTIALKALIVVLLSCSR